MTNVAPLKAEKDHETKARIARDRAKAIDLRLVRAGRSKEKLSSGV